MPQPRPRPRRSSRATRSNPLHDIKRVKPGNESRKPAPSKDPFDRRTSTTPASKDPPVSGTTPAPKKSPVTGSTPASDEEGEEVLERRKVKLAVDEEESEEEILLRRPTKRRQQYSRDVVEVDDDDDDDDDDESDELNGVFTQVPREEDDMDFEALLSESFTDDLVDDIEDTSPAQPLPPPVPMRSLTMPAPKPSLKTATPTLPPKTATPTLPLKTPTTTLPLKTPTLTLPLTSTTTLPLTSTTTLPLTSTTTLPLTSATTSATTLPTRTSSSMPSVSQPSLFTAVDMASFKKHLIARVDGAHDRIQAVSNVLKAVQVVKKRHEDNILRHGGDINRMQQRLQAQQEVMEVLHSNWLGHEQRISHLEDIIKQLHQYLGTAMTASEAEVDPPSNSS
ncbi:hypothetical protein DFQ27_008153 [Actinomortierella ambigua]|uniref:Uncharacterized protein n=1 Tax=Actinomortierella ambigua TaxID=1343610 RepID=A0A9P6TYQ4_9FUNG|nr:hypothetical protein DFQ27_008153 [Actinomortierella ambigua]